MNLIEIISIRRSGHHAFINWLFANLAGPHISPPSNVYSYILPNILYVNEAEFNWGSHQKYVSKVLDKVDYVFSSTETVPANFSILCERNPTFVNAFQSHFYKPWKVKNYKRIFFIRDFYNCFASQIKSGGDKYWGEENEYNKRMYNSWKSHLKASLKGDYTVFYDKFISNPEYANQVCEDILGFSNSYNPLDIKGTISSFDSQEKVNLDKYLTRYKNFDFPEWFKLKVQCDSELQYMLGKADMNYLF